MRRTRRLWCPGIQVQSVSTVDRYDQNSTPRRHIKQIFNTGYIPFVTKQEQLSHLRRPVS
jgi:hypothetical protein